MMTCRLIFVYSDVKKGGEVAFFWWFNSVNYFSFAAAGARSSPAAPAYVFAGGGFELLGSRWGGGGGGAVATGGGRTWRVAMEQVSVVMAVAWLLTALLSEAICSWARPTERLNFLVFGSGSR